MLGSASIRKKEFITASVAVAVTACLMIASGTRVNAEDLPRWFAQIYTSPFDHSTAPRTALLRRHSGESLYSLVHGFRQAHTAREVDAARNSAFRQRSGSEIALPVPGARFGGIRFNELGWRGPSLPKVKPDNTVIIAFLGNSITLDKNTIPDGRSWPALATQNLQKVFPACRLVYQNIGIPGLSSRTLGTFYREQVLPKVQPDIAVVMTDDRKIRLRELAEVADAPTEGPSPLLFSRAQLLQRYAQDLPALLNTILQNDAIPVLLSFGQHLAPYTVYSQPGRMLGRTGAERALYVSREGLEQSARWYNDENRRTTAQLDIAYLQWHKALTGEQHYLDQRHFQPAGSALMAEVLTEQLAQSPAFLAALAEKHPCAAADEGHPAAQPSLLPF